MSDIAPPPPLSSSPPPPVSNKWIINWAVVGLFFALLIGLTLTSINQNSEEKSNEGYQFQQVTTLKLAYRQQSLESWLQPMTPTTPSTAAASASTVSFSRVARELKSTWNRSDTATALYAVALTASGQTVPKDVIRSLRTSKDEAFHPLGRLYGSEKLSRQDAEEIASEVQDLPNVGEFAALHAFQKAGDQKALGRFFPATAMLPFMVLILIMLGGMLLGIVAWIVFFASKAKLRPAGPLFSPISQERSGLFGLLSIGLIWLWVLMDLLFIPIDHYLSDGAQSGIKGLTFLVVLFIILAKVRVADRPITSYLNQSSLKIPTQIGIGIVGWAANLPIIGLILFGVNQWVQDSNAEHPLNEMLASSPDTLTYVMLFVAAAVVAPIWEEIVFRGTLFSGLYHAFRNPKVGLIASTVLSSLVFAAIHPQGPALWLGLGWIGAMGCILTYYTRSIIPAIVMHAVHNGMLVMLSLQILA